MKIRLAGMIGCLLMVIALTGCVITSSGSGRYHEEMIGKVDWSDPTPETIQFRQTGFSRQGLELTVGQAYEVRFINLSDNAVRVNFRSAYDLMAIKEIKLEGARIATGLVDNMVIDAGQQVTLQMTTVAPREEPVVASRGGQNETFEFTIRGVSPSDRSTGQPWWMPY